MPSALPIHTDANAKSEQKFEAKMARASKAMQVIRDNPKLMMAHKAQKVFSSLAKRPHDLINWHFIIGDIESLAP